ncbi:MAG TPA: DUF456 domain-containing protein [Myxococcales bacterium]|nr:hypothetical protein [Myxococcales bacterium]HAN31137.1 DUF456 domain-containing protein [Myxococcales bacterium]
MMLALCATTGALLVLMGLLGCFVPGMPGPTLSYAGLLLLGPTECELSLPWMIALGVFCILVTVLDVLLPSLTARQFGGSKWGAWGALVGLLIGLVVLPPGGALVGAFLGAWTLEVLGSGRNWSQGAKPAFGALVGLALGTLGQMAACLAVGGYFTFALMGLI